MVATQTIPAAGQKVDGAPVAGLLGADVLSTFAIATFDFKGRRLVLHGQVPGGRAVPLSVRTDGKIVPSVTATVAGQSGHWVMDTGADTTTIDTNEATRLGLVKVGHTLPISTVSCKTTTQPVEIKKWSLKGVDLPQAVALSSPSAITTRTHGLLVGLIGENVMASFGTVTLDLAGRKLIVGNVTRVTTAASNAGSGRHPSLVRQPSSASERHLRWDPDAGEGRQRRA